MKTTRKLTMAAVGLFALVATTDLLMMSSAQAQPPQAPVALVALVVPAVLDLEVEDG